MILEVALLNIRPGLSVEFEKAFAKALSIISIMPEYKRHEVGRYIFPAR
jgi:heme-degrading monooxygenase HmoA